MTCPASVKLAELHIQQFIVGSFMVLFVFILEMNGQADVDVDYKRKYKNLKRKLKFLVYVSDQNLCF